MAERNTCRRGAGEEGERGARTRPPPRRIFRREVAFCDPFDLREACSRRTVRNEAHRLSGEHKASGASPPSLPLLLRPYATRARVQDVYTYTHVYAHRRGSHECIVVDFEPRSIKPHRRARARTYSIRFFTRSDWPLLHGAVRQSDRVVDKLTRYMPTTLRPWYTPRFYCFPNSSSGIFKLVFPPPTSIPNKRNLKSNDPSLIS